MKKIDETLRALLLDYFERVYLEYDRDLRDTADWLIEQMDMAYFVLSGLDVKRIFERLPKPVRYYTQDQIKGALISELEDVLNNDLKNTWWRGKESENY